MKITKNLISVSLLFVNAFACFTFLKNKTSNYTINYFRETLVKVYRDIAKEQNKDISLNKLINIQNCEIDRFNKYKTAYESLYVEFKEIPFEEKLDILINKINTSKLTKVDKLSYIDKLIDIIFSNEKGKKIDFVIIKDNRELKEGILGKTNAIISINTKDLRENREDTFFYIIKEEKLTIIEKEELEKLFISDLEFLKRGKNKILGSSIKKGVR